MTRPPSSAPLFDPDTLRPLPRPRPRRSWRPVAAKRWPGVLSISGRGPFAVIQGCGGYRWWSIVLCDSREEAEGRRHEDCGFDGAWGCQPRRHVIVDLTRPRQGVSPAR